MRLSSYFYRAGSVLGRKPLLDFYYRCLTSQASGHWLRHGFVPFNYYEFGTGYGRSMKCFVQALKVFSREHKIDSSQYNIFAFDSFKGLPEYSGQKDANPSWEGGQFCSSEAEIKKIVQAGGIRTSLELIEGFFEDSLNEDLQKRLNKYRPSIINIDVDYYTSTKLVLDWLFPILQNGTIIYFDDIYEYLGDPTKGEIAAMREFTGKRRVTLTPYYEHGIPSLFGKTYIFSFNKY